MIECNTHKLVWSVYRWDNEANRWWFVMCSRFKLVALKHSMAMNEVTKMQIA